MAALVKVGSARQLPIDKMDAEAAGQPSHHWEGLIPTPTLLPNHSSSCSISQIWSLVFVQKRLSVFLTIDKMGDDGRG